MTKYLSSSACKFLLFVHVFAFLSFISFAQDISSDAAAITAGQALFNANCKTCHRVHQKLVGPALKDVHKRAPSIDWIKAFVKNSSAVIASGEPYAVKVFEENGKMQMTSFSGLKDEEIMNILAYVKDDSEKGPAVAVVPTPGGDGQVHKDAGLSSTYMNIILIGMLIILVLLLVVLGVIISALKRFLGDKNLSEEDKEIVNPPVNSRSIFKSSGFLFIVLFLTAGLGFKAVINGLYSIGIQQGYAPKQPIAFSHKIHAGDYEIDCKYCHVGVMKNKNATIPSVNICMNCHNQIKTGTLTGDVQIKLITDAYANNKPIEWVRIHNLPDLAYFNHAQHVNVAGVECQTCHGPIETMEVVRQHSLLTMGWCIDCHRKTDVNTKGNAYYDNLVELHNKSKKTPMKVEDMGGLECSKCHY